MQSKARWAATIIIMIPLTSGSLAAGCGGSTDGGADGTNGGAGGAASTGGAGGGNGTIEATCSVDSDCVAASSTSDPCYSPGCEIPVAASVDDLARIDCLKAWDGVSAPPVSEDCIPQGRDDVPCAAACAMPPTCVRPYCEAGTCKLEMSQEAGATCERPSGDGCAALDAAREEALQEARACVADGTAGECTAGLTIADECGCPVLVNESQQTLVSRATQERLAWATACDPPERCSLIDCRPSEGSGSCVDDGAGGFVCSW